MDKLILVDGDDNEIGSGDKHDVHLRPGQTHRAFSFFLFNPKGELFLQRRAANKMLWPGHWSNSFCSHPKKGEDMLPAVCRRAQEELGISLSNPIYLYRFSYQAQYKDVGYEDEVCSVLFAVDDVTPSINKSEISDGIFVHHNQVSDFISKHTQEVTPWFKMEWKEICRNHIAGIVREIDEA